MLLQLVAYFLVTSPRKKVYSAPVKRKTSTRVQQKSTCLNCNKYWSLWTFWQLHKNIYNIYNIYKNSPYQQEIVSSNPSDSTAICGARSQESLVVTVSLWMTGTEYLSIKVTLANCGCLWAHVCRWRQIELSSKCVTLACDAKWGLAGFMGLGRSTI